MNQPDLIRIAPPVYQHRVVTVHLEHPEAPASNLCGTGSTRYDPNTTDESQVTCLNCLLDLERGTMADL